MRKFNLSVHELVDFVLHSGDLDTRVFNLETMSRGTQIHTFYQAKQNDKYLAEYALEHTFEYENHLITLQGRVDGVIVNGNEVTIEEIKSANTDIDKFYEAHEAWHLGQAKCYALMYALRFDLDTIDIQLTYISQLDDRKTFKRYTFSREELQSDVYSYFGEYLAFFYQVEKYQKRRTKALGALNFPYQAARTSQKIMMEQVEYALENEHKIYFNAPTGSGKTMAVLYPSLKVLAEKSDTKIFYLTAKGSGKAQAENALKVVRQTALIKSTTVNAREKMCLNDKVACNPDECPFAVNYYGKIRNALLDAFRSGDEYNREFIMEYAKKHNLCPFEYQLDLTLLSDVIIADYNYLFDPFVYLRRFFDAKRGNYIALVDEAHNLPRRVMDNYSLVLDFSPFYSFRKVLKGTEHKKIRRIINRIVKDLDEYKDGIGSEFETIAEFPAELRSSLDRFLVIGSEYMQEIGDKLVEGFSDFFFDVNKFIKILDLADSDDFVLFTEVDEERKFFPKFYVKCLNGAKFINEFLRIIDHAIFFSATLAPAPYFKTMLDIDDDIHQIPNPFKREQLLIMVDGSTSLYYKDRDQTLSTVAAKIRAAISVKVGNYIVYTPSFVYLENLERELGNSDDYDLIVQRSSMSDVEKEEYLDTFKLSPTKTTLGLAVLGGSFSEGVDLVSDRLSGVIILGVGYPPPSFEKELEKDYFDNKLNDGISYAYVYPALNKILQTMGRVIRSEVDYGFILLMDKRYNYNPYRSQLENYDGFVVQVKDAERISHLLARFFLN
ncbi:MAG: bifunctional ATP-dependent DNA helicase/DNA polymerase III subunit epsilon [Tenericutes bacterium ADurb.Bin087]|nr:MAG: bifunctional ATP-dependent DNA helicase/DNA polymerase III subunit epsilon [Tenericutes bacterium ADurb.Bin087]